MSVDNKETVKHLNIVLSNELTAINQYFLHARMMKHMNHMKLADYEYKESIQQMKSADSLVERILSLGGIPNLAEFKKLRIGSTVEEILKCDLETEEDTTDSLNDAISVCESKNDDVSVDILQQILQNEKERVGFIRSQLNIVDSVGLEKYLQM